MSPGRRPQTGRACDFDKSGWRVDYPAGMGLELRWVGESDYDRVAQTRLRCYAPSVDLLAHYQRGIRADRRGRPGDFLLAERAGEAVGTSTSLSLAIWMRGARLRCQGVAFVGTIKTARRLGGGEEAGVATQLMRETLRMAREREEPISALMPFRASYYEHFGYGNAERRVDWTVPIGLLPRGDFEGFRFFSPEDRSAMLAARQRECEAGQCDVETSPEAFDYWAEHYWPEGMTVVDASGEGGAARGWVYFNDQRDASTATLVVNDWCADSPATLRRILHLLASLKDQYSFVRITLPVDVPLNRLLKESQIPHRQVDHPVSAAKPYTRMQIRILDHKRALEAMRLPAWARGKATIAVHECEGSVSRFTLDVSEGRASVTPATHTSADLELSDVLWASLVSGDLPAGQAARLGLLPSATSAATVSLLEAFAVGPAPFCQEYF